MDRRTFLQSGVGVVSAATVGGTTMGTAKAADQATPRLRTKIAVAPQWFQGSHIEQMEQIHAAGFSAFETLGCGSWDDKEAVRTRCQELGVECGAVGGGMGSINGWGPNDPENLSRFVEAVKASIANAKAIGSKRVLALSGADRKGVEKKQQMDALVKAGTGRGPHAGRRRNGSRLGMLKCAG